MTNTIGIKSNQKLVGDNPVTLEVVQSQIKESFEKAKIETSIKINEQVQTDKASLITVFGIFASIISFLTIEFQFLRTVCSFEKLLGFTLVLASLLLCFNLALDYLVKSRIDTETPKPNTSFTILIIFLFLFGVGCISFGNEETCKENKIYEKYSEEFDSQQTEFNQKYKVEQDQKYNELNNRVKTIENKINKP